MTTGREAWPQHLGTCRRCGRTYLLGTSCGDADHLSTGRIPMTEHPLPSSREGLQYQVTELEKEYHQRFLTDPAFHARSRMIGNFLDQLESIHEAGDTDRVGFLIAALLDKAGPNLAAQGWERGMADAKLLAAGIRPLVRNPYLKEGE